MHQYLKAIGFGNISKKRELNEILTQVENSFTQQDLIAQDEEMDLCEYQKEYGAGIGIALYGDMDIHEAFKRNYYYPYFLGTGITSHADVSIERRLDKEAYVGICEEMKVGINLIFHLQNTVDLIKRQQTTKNSVKYKSVTLSGLCNGGTILLPVLKDKEQEKRQKEAVQNRMMLVSAARTGDPAAIESLTMDDIDTYSKVSQRLISEDVFSIVDTYIMPYGIECDHYSILGEIKEIQRIINEYTAEELFIMKLDVNDLTFDICVPVEKIIGDPAVGRRFKGNMWLQGRINF
ncbi:MAG: DUF3881 family protein [Dorea sp.]|jgi:hypothetical protein|nr:DUF3881 family protein [Dorea sp.]MCI9614282.1 DUF3881 family protein [Dorea sp.]MDE6937348.1 DUF3881 family protein [Lachnospiraceae bacterium]MDE7039028.1 DUF3881 family protein [Lachnospiraceae bacterium]